MHPKDDSMNSSLISRREAIQRVAAATSITYAAAPLAVAQSVSTGGAPHHKG